MAPGFPGSGHLRTLAHAIKCSVERRLLLRTGPSSRYQPLGPLGNVGWQMVKLEPPDPSNLTWLCPYQLSCSVSYRAPPGRLI